MKKIIYILLFLSTLLYSNVLQKAIDSAKEGSILKLSRGIYDGNIVINKPLSVIGKEKGVVIRGDGKGNVVTITSSFVTLKNLTIINSGARQDILNNAVLVKDVKQVEISNNIIKDSLFGINLQIVTNSIISNNFIQSKDLPLGLRGDGIKLWYCSGNIISKNELYKSRDLIVWYSHSNIIENNKASLGRYSLHFMHAGKNIIRGNIFQLNSVGLFFMYSRDSIVENNIIKNSLGTAGMGIGLKEADNMTIRNNTILYNAIALYVDRSPYDPQKPNLFENNKILYNTEGIRFHSISENNKIVYNQFIGNIDDITTTTPKNKIYNNFFENNFWDNYEGFDKDNDNIGDTSHKIYQYADKLWIYNNSIRYFYGSPLISLLNFLAKLAPFSEPVFILEDKKPRMSVK